MRRSLIKVTDPILESSTKPTADRDNEEFFINLLEGNSRDAAKWYATPVFCCSYQVTSRNWS